MKVKLVAVMALAAVAVSMAAMASTRRRCRRPSTPGYTTSWCRCACNGTGGD
jgi:hypothetical protein